MKLTENTKVRVRVPKHLYEAIQAELDKKHGMEEGHYGDKEMEEGEYGHHDKMEEDASLVDIGAQIVADPANAFEILKTGLEMSANELQNFLAGLGTITGLGSGAIIAGLKDAKNKKAAKSKAAAAQQSVAEEEVELEETLDLETLMEAVKDASKKKAEEKKKKEAEAKKKKEAEDKKKKEAEAKKKAEAAKKK